MDSYKQRSTLKGRVTRLKKKIQEGVANAFQAKVDLDKLCQYEVELQVLQDNILKVCSDEDHDKEEDYFEDVSTQIGELKAKLSEIITPESANSVKSETVSVIPALKSNIKLPQIQIPTFDGSIENWATFKDLFSELIHKNDELQPIQRFQYLKTSLVDEAASLIQHLPLTSANYYIAWNILIDTYANKYSTVTFHLKNLFNVQYQSQNRMSSLKTMLTVVRTNLNALTSLGIDTQSWDILIIYLLETKIDDDLYHDWVKKFDSKKLPTLNMFFDFLREMIVISERTEQKMVSKSKLNIIRETSLPSLCFLCKLQHRLYECVQFKNLPMTEKNAFVNKNKICYNCLSSNQHSANKCTSKSLCKICSKKHHSMLHNFSSQVNYAADEENFCGGEATPSSQQGSTSENSEDSTIVCTQMENGFKEQVLLSTAVVRVEVSTGNYYYVRALLDSGSQSCFISSQCVKKLGLREQNMNPISVNGIGGSSTLEINKFCECLVESRYNNYHLLIKALVIPKVTNKLPAFSLNKLSWDYTKNLNLSDPDFHTSRDIDMIIGAEHFFTLLESGFIQGPPGYPSIQNSKFGWIVAGKIMNTVTSNISSFHVNLDTTLKRFWEVEERDCEEHFVQNVQRVEDGRCMVKLPFKNNIQVLGESLNLKSVEKNIDIASEKAKGKKISYPKVSQEKRKLKSTTCIVQDDVQKIKLWNNVSSSVTIINITAWCLHFKNNLLCKLRNEELRRSLLLTEEVKKEKITIIKLVQQEVFSRELDSIEKYGVVKSDSKIKTLNPFMDHSALLKVGGRLINSDLLDNAKHQVLLPQSLKFTELLVQKHAHAGPSLLLAIIRQKYWIIQGHSVIKKIFHNCSMSCFRANPVRGNITLMMGELTQNRVKASPPFSSCGVDYAGPVSVRRVDGRSNVLCKDYIALFVCFTFDCYHINLVSDLSSMNLIAALRRFVSRRGVPTDIYAGNGNVLIYTDGVLNSRPLTPMSNDVVYDLEVLTPGHFLIGRSLSAVPETDVTSSSNNRLRRWFLTQKITQDFWKRWSLEYLTTLNQRFKWKYKRENVKSGDLVLMIYLLESGDWEEYVNCFLVMTTSSES